MPDIMLRSPLPPLRVHRERFGDLDATNVRAVFKLTAETKVTETDESPLEIGEPKNGRQGQDAMDGGLRRTETGMSSFAVPQAGIRRRA